MTDGGIFYPQVTHLVSGNTTGTTSPISSGTYVLAGGNNITLSQDGNTVTIVGGAGGGGDAIRGIAAGGSTATTNSVNFSNSNGVSFGFGAAGNSTVLTASHNALTSQSNQAASGSNGSFTFQTLTFSNANGVSFGTSAGSALVASVVTSYAPSNHSHGNPILALTNLTGTTASASNGFTLSLSGNAAAGDAIRGIAAGGSTATTNSVNFSNSNGVSFGFGAAGNSTILTASHNGLTSQSTQFLAIALGGNTAGTTTFNASNNASIFLHGGNNITLSGNGSSITISAGAGGGGAVVSNAIQQVSSATGSGTNTSRFAADDHVHAGVYGVGVSNDAGNTVGNTRVSFGQHVFRGGANITLSQITAANELNTIVISAAAPGGAGSPKSYFAALGGVSYNSIAVQISGSTSIMQPVILPYDVSVSYVRFPVTMSASGSLTNVGTAVNATSGMTQSSTINVVFYSLGVVGNSRSLQFVASGSASFVHQATIIAGATGSHWSSGHTVSYPFEGEQTNFTVSGAATSASVTMQSSQISNFTALRFIDVPFATSLSAGAYWMLYGSSTRLSTTGTANMSTLRILASNIGVSQPNQIFNLMGRAANNSVQPQIGLGNYSTNSIGATVASVALANISSRASNPQLFFQMIRQA